MSKGIQYLICSCGARNESITHQLAADNWFQERHIDYARCPKCSKHLLQKRFVSVNDERVCPPLMTGFEKVWNKYQDFLTCEVQSFDNDFVRSLKYKGGLVRNMHYSVKGVEYRTDHVRTGRKFNGDKWLTQQNGKYR